MLVASGALAADSNCQLEQFPVGSQKLGAWIDKSNWLSIENQRVTLHASEVFMPHPARCNPSFSQPAWRNEYQSGQVIRRQVRHSLPPGTVHFNRSA
ncbi:MAG: hypothetical protein IPO50_15810 [Sphingomonadales bacterium]|nr:hypothetical protein [Sphingomonadales bacterium]